MIKIMVMINFVFVVILIIATLTHMKICGHVDVNIVHAANLNLVSDLMEIKIQFTEEEINKTIEEIEDLMTHRKSPDYFKKLEELREILLKGEGSRGG